MQAFCDMKRITMADLSWGEIVSLINYCNAAQRVLGESVLLPLVKKNNLIKRTTKGHLQHIGETAGVYFCIATNAKGARHCFVVDSVNPTSSYLYDPQLGKEPVLYDNHATEWINSWVGAFKVSVAT